MQGFVASHDGYAARFGIYHERELSLSAEGAILSGLDRFIRAGGARPEDNGRDLVTIRFHLHPDVELYRNEGDRMVLASPHADSWVMDCEEVRPEIEESIFFAGLGGPRHSRQIVLSFKASQTPVVHWELKRMRPAGQAQQI
jgi:uncharacterized heparinase superfamily protein